MAISISKRVYRIFFANGAISLFVVIIAVWFGYSDLEKTWLELDLREEMRLLNEHSEIVHPGSWKTSDMTAVWIPSSAPREELPEIFRAIPVPFLGPVVRDGKMYQIISEYRDDGAYFLAKDVTNFENREKTFKVLLVILALIVLLFNAVLAQLHSRRLIKPLRQLTTQIQRAVVNRSMKPVDNNYGEIELNEIAAAINGFITEIDAFVQRERLLLNLASHELRTPIATISGALQVIEQRQNLNAEDQKTFHRIKRACREMQDNVESLLKLSRRSLEQAPEYFAVKSVILELMDELANADPTFSARLTMTLSVDQNSGAVCSDRLLVKMLIRNLVQNALQHTQGNVVAHVTGSYLDIVDQGAGLPDSAREVLHKPVTSHHPEWTGLGLYIVSLICERLDWRIKVLADPDGGSVLRLWFIPTNNDDFDKKPTRS